MYLQHTLLFRRAGIASFSQSDHPCGDDFGRFRGLFGHDRLVVVEEKISLLNSVEELHT